MLRKHAQGCRPDSPVQVCSVIMLNSCFSDTIFVPFLCQESDEIVGKYFKYCAIFPRCAILFADIGMNETIYKIPEQFKSLCPCQRKVRNSLYSNEFRTFLLSCVLPKSPMDVGAVGAKVGANQKSWCKSWCKLLFQIQVMLYDLRHGQTPCRIF